LYRFGAVPDHLGGWSAARKTAQTAKSARRSGKKQKHFEKSYLGIAKAFMPKNRRDFGDPLPPKLQN
jgi:hypothetical protein